MGKTRDLFKKIRVLQSTERRPKFMLQYKKDHGEKYNGDHKEKVERQKNNA